MTIMWRRRWIIVASMIVAVAVGWVVFTKITPKFSSTAKLHLRQVIPHLAVGQATQAVPALSVSTEFEIIKSTALLEQALKVPALRSAGLLQDVSNPIDFLQSVLLVSAGRADDIILVSVECTNPNDAAAIANGVTEAYTRYNAEQQQSSSAEVLKILQQEKTRRETEYKQIKESLNQLRRKSGILTIDANKGNIETQRLAELSMQFQSAELETTNARIISKRLDELKDFPDPLKAFISSQSATLGFAGGALVDQVDVDNQRYRETLRDLESRYGSSYPEVVRLRWLLAKTPTHNDSQYVEAFRALTAQRLATAETREVALQAQLEQQRDRTLNLNAQEQEYASLENDATRTEKLLDLLDNRIKEVDLNGVAGTLTVSTLDAAKPNAIPVSPQRNKIMGLAAVAGLALGIALAMIRDLLDQRLRSLEEIEDTLGTRILGTVPTLGKGVYPVIAGKTVDTCPISDVAEAYRSIRTSVFMSRNNARSRTILVTSATPGEGKSTTASNLAIATAQLGRRVLLIDADCRMPAQHVIFKVNDGLERGLSSVLTKQAKVDEVIRPTGIDKLDLMTSGPLCSRPAEMLNGRGLEQMLTNLGGRYDHIFIDSPPVVPVTDARVLTAVCDMTVLVLRAERSTRKQTLRARDALESVGGRLLGVVVNDAPRRRAQYGCDFEVYPAHGGEGRSSGKGRRRVVQRAVPALPDEEQQSARSS